MTDIEAPENPQDTPVTPDESAPEGTPEDTGSRTEQVDAYEKRYNDLRPEFDRTKQQLAQYEQFLGNLQNPETRNEALAALGFEIEADEPDDADDIDPYEPRIGKLEQTIQQFAEQQAQAQYEQKLAEYAEQQLDELDPDGSFSDEYVEMLASVAPADQDGLPDLKTAHDRLQKFADTEFNARLKAKKAPQAPSGASPSNNPDLDDSKARREWMAQQLAGAQSLA